MFNHYSRLKFVWKVVVVVFFIPKLYLNNKSLFISFISLGLAMSAIITTTKFIICQQGGNNTTQITLQMFARQTEVLCVPIQRWE